MSGARRLTTRTPRTTVAHVKRMVLASVAFLFAASCTSNDSKSLFGPKLQGLAHVPVFSTVTSSSGATFTTDKDDYSPGETLNLSGSGWSTNDVLDVHLDETPQNHPPADWTINADENGSFTDGSYVVQESDLGVTFTITATSQLTGDVAQATFTDNPCPANLSAATPISPSLLAFTESGTTTRTYGVVTTNQSPSGGVPGIRELCVYHNGTTSSVAALYDSWVASEPGGGATRIEFAHAPPLAEANNIPLNGSSVTVGTATFSTQPTSETIVAHISWAAQCPVGTNTCFKILSPPGGGGDAEGPTIEKDAAGSYDNTYTWSITKAVDKTTVKQIGGSATFNYTINVTHDGGTVSNVKVSGTITVTNPNADAITADVTDALSDATTCTVTGGSGATLVSGPNTFAYSCDLSGLPQGELTNTATVTWAEQTLSPSGDHLAAGSADFTAPASGGISFTGNDIDECVNVSDSYAGSLGTACVGDANPKSFTYSRTIAVPTNDCQSYDNTATFTTNDTGATGSASQTVTVCGPAKTGALTIGFWKTTNGQNLIKTYCANTLDDYLAGLGGGSGPFSDAAGKTCSQLATYVYNILTAASASNMNAMLKAQMLGTALDVWFSGPGWTSTKSGGVKPPSNFLSHNNLGTFKMDVTAVCPMVDNLSTGTATCKNNTPSTDAVAAGAVPTSPMSMQTILDFAATTPSPFNGVTGSGSVWYVGDRTKEEILKNIFDQFNNQLAFGSF